MDMIIWTKLINNLCYVSPVYLNPKNGVNKTNQMLIRKQGNKSATQLRVGKLVTLQFKEAQQAQRSALLHPV